MYEVVRIDHSRETAADLFQNCAMIFLNGHTLAHRNDLIESA